MINYSHWSLFFPYYFFLCVLAKALIINDLCQSMLNRPKRRGKKSVYFHNMKIGNMKLVLCLYPYLKTQIQTWSINDR